MADELGFGETLRLERLEADLFRGHCHAGSPQRAFGGQVAAQALVAAGGTVPDDRFVHSLHGYFIRGGRSDQPIVYSVDRVRDGRSFTTRRVVAVQDGKAIFGLSASFHGEESGPTHQKPMPETVPPEDAEPAPDRWSAYAGSLEIRFNDVSSAADLPRRQIWVRSRHPLGDDHLRNVCALTYTSDIGLAGTAFLGRLNPRNPFQLSSLDHAVWFHRPFSLDDWLLFDTESPNYASTRGLAHGTFYTRSGTLVASVTQEVLIRPLPRD
ncbi:acyl-CoA thioesterase-2 [Actinocorallia herbida]|uniref:Acyl-CoA thioesterase 2 n=1 Tax=Actinocorallia herbida TaxID=58109 RepID=A0A3N1CZX2_9ACTN|nr:acyl-CoA thioesterase II [Actinocorallia herbida]ROO86819.1 acyl-CoA thioesterase-2 [Actinocorallia herbida]